MKHEHEYQLIYSSASGPVKSSAENHRPRHMTTVQDQRRGDNIMLHYYYFVAIFAENYPDDL